jgi:methionine biosynthesis protein MetW
LGEFFSKKKVNKLLDLGCGNGEFTVKLGKDLSVSDIYGVDISDEAIRMSKEKGVKAIKVDLEAEKLPFPPKFFDLVAAIEVIEHLRYPDNMLAEAWRVLKPGGYFVISTPNLASWINRLLILMGYMPYFSEPSEKYLAGFYAHNKINVNPAGTLRLYTLKALRELLQVYGFSVVKISGSYADYENRFLRVLDMLISWIKPSLASDIILIAQKLIRENESE